MIRAMGTELIRVTYNSNLLPNCYLQSTFFFSNHFCFFSQGVTWTPVLLRPLSKTNALFNSVITEKLLKRILPAREV